MEKHSLAPGIVLLHSPLVGPLTWQLVADYLRARGCKVLVPSLLGQVQGGPPYYDRLAAATVRAVRAVWTGGPVALAGHSGAGALLPVVSTALGGRVQAAVFVDATLPHPGQSWFEATPALGEQLRGLATDGRLPPWHQWFPATLLEAAVPDEQLRAHFVAELPRVPLAYFEEPAPVVEHWPSFHCGHVQLSPIYGHELNEAEQRGWFTANEALGHLGILTEPRRSADLLLSLLTVCGVSP